MQRIDKDQEKKKTKHKAFFYASESIEFLVQIMKDLPLFKWPREASF